MGSGASTDVGQGPDAVKARAQAAHACLGVIRLDYDYPPAPGDIDHPGSYSYDVYYRVVPGLTFEKCQNAGINGENLPEDVKKEFIEAIHFLVNEKKVSGITGDCGFMMWLQGLARQHCHVPIFMSSLCSLPAITCAFGKTEKIAIFTANSETLTPMKDLIKDECGVDPDESRFVIVGCQDVEGFEAVAEGGKVPVAEVTPGMVAKAQAVIAAESEQGTPIRAILMECTELPPYSDALRAATGLPVYDAITNCDFFLDSRMDNPRFGINDWHKGWDGKQEEYVFGQELSAEDKAKTQNLSAENTDTAVDQHEIANEGDQQAAAVAATDIGKELTATKKAHASLGVIRLDYDYPPAPGDIDHPGSYDYDVFYRVVPGLTFEMCQAGKMTDEVKAEFIEAVHWLEARGVTGITGDCGFMMWFQALARESGKGGCPVFMSALAQLPAVTAAYGGHEKIAIMTANSETLLPMKDLIRDECGMEMDDGERYIFVGCQDVPGFEAVAAGEKVDVEAVTPGMIAKAKSVLEQHPEIRAILLECTELPPYADALRAELGIPVFDAITNCDMFINGTIDNPRFGLNDWQEKWDGKQDHYKFGQELDAEDKAKLVNEVE